MHKTHNSSNLIRQIRSNQASKQFSVFFFEHSAPVVGRNCLRSFVRFISSFPLRAGYVDVGENHIVFPSTSSMACCDLRVRPFRTPNASKSDSKANLFDLLPTPRCVLFRFFSESPLYVRFLRFTFLPEPEPQTSLNGPRK